MLQSTHRLVMAGLVAFGLATGAAILVVILVAGDRRNSKSTAVTQDYCCAIVGMNETTCASDTSACGSDQDACLACNMEWVPIDSVDSNDDNDGEGTSTPVGALRSGQPTPAPREGPSSFTSMPPIPSSDSQAIWTTNLPTETFTHQPTTLQPTFSDPGQACLEAATDGKAVATPLAMPSTNNEPVLLARSAANQLCTLWQVDSERTRIIPVGRSYEGHQWEAYASELVSPPASFSCDPSVCSIVLPPLPSGYTYELAAFAHKLPFRDEMARFFGANHIWTYQGGLK